MNEVDTPPIAENEYVKGLLAVLQAHSVPGSKELVEMIGHVTEMEQQLADATSELKSMREEIQGMQDRTLKASLQKSCKALENNVSTLRQHLSDLKDSIVQGCKDALADFKERGVAALNGLAHFFHVKPALESLRAGFEQSIRIDSKAIAKIEAVSAEYHEAGRHLKNMGRALIGKEPTAEVKGTGRFAKALQAPYRADRACASAAKRSVEKTLGNLERLEQVAQRKPSVLDAVRENGAKVQRQAQPAPERPRSDPSR